MKSRILRVFDFHHREFGFFVRNLTRVVLVQVGIFLSILAHEFGHCILYWIQGIPALMSLTKEFPLVPVLSMTQYGIGSMGGPMANLVLLITGLSLSRHLREGTFSGLIGPVLTWANSLILFLTGLLCILKRRPGELGAIAELIGIHSMSLPIVVTVLGFMGIAVWYLLYARRSIRRVAGAYVASLFVMFIQLLVVQAADVRWFWHRFGEIHLENGRIYHSPNMGRRIPQPSQLEPK